MGQAKRRGTYEQRVAQAIAKKNAEALKQKQEDEARLEAIRNNPAVIASKICGNKRPNFQPRPSIAGLAAMLGILSLNQDGRTFNK